MEHRRRIPYGLYLMVWAGLLVLTALTVTVAGLHLGTASVAAAVCIAAAKAALVLLYFMHLKYEPAVFRTMLGLAVGIIVVILLLTFSDVAFRA